MNSSVISAGFSTFSIGLAQLRRQLLLAKAILSEGTEVTVLCPYGIHSETDMIPAEGIFEGINFIHSSGTSICQNNHFKQNVQKIPCITDFIKFDLTIMGDPCIINEKNILFCGSVL